MTPVNSTARDSNARIAAIAPASSIAINAARPFAAAGCGPCRMVARLSPAMTAAAPRVEPAPPRTFVAALAKVASQSLTRRTCPGHPQRQLRCRTAFQGGCHGLSVDEEA